MGTALPTTPDYSTALPESGGMTAFGGMAIGTLFAFLGIFFIFVLIGATITIVFQGIGIMKMHQKLGLKNGWMAFVPFLNQYALGKVAEQYIKENGKKSLKFSVILLISNILPMIIISIYLIFAFFAGMSLGFSGASDFDIQTTTSVMSAVFCLVYYPIVIAISVIQYVALWRIYAIFSNENATLFLILSIFVSFVTPFLIFAIRNNEPCCVEIKPNEEVPVIEELPVDM